MWGDMDAFGHINNVIYMRYFETARVRYFETMPTFTNFSEPAKPVLVSLSGEYKRPVVHPDTLSIFVGVKKLGNASMTMGCEMYSDKGYLAFVGECTLVMVDLEKNRPVRVPEDMRTFVLSVDGEGILQ